MCYTYVYLNTVEKVKDFVGIINTFDGDFDLVIDRYVVDAKSLLAIFSLDISNVLRLDIHDETTFEMVTTALQDFIVKQ